MPVQFLTPEQRAHYGRYFHLDDTDQALIGAKRGDHHRLRFGLTRLQRCRPLTRFYVPLLSKPAGASNTDFKSR